MNCFDLAYQQGHTSSQLGFDWKSAEQVMEKVDEEISELHEAINSKESSAIYHELGDVCLALSSLARHLNISLEDVFMAAIQRFDLRWETMMRVAENSQINVRDLSPTEWEKLWQQAKIQVDKH